VLALVLGRATRLAQFLTASDKAYEASVRLGTRTSTGDAQGSPEGPTYRGPWPSRDAVDQALDAFRGTFLQQPPAVSAKKIAGKRSYALARAAARDATGQPAPPTLPTPTTVTVHRLEVVSVDEDLVTLNLACSAGFYVRSLAQDLGDRLGTGAHLETLCRTRSGEFRLDEAVTLEAIESDPGDTLGLIIPLRALLTRFPSVVLTSDGVERALHGQELRPQDSAIGDFGLRIADYGLVRMLDSSGELLGIAEPSRTSGLLHPSVVLV
jgi:tRNA pseudouridine55 synthase